MYLDEGLYSQCWNFIDTIQALRRFLDNVIKRQRHKEMRKTGSYGEMIADQVRRYRAPIPSCTYRLKLSLKDRNARLSRRPDHIKITSW